MSVPIACYRCGTERLVEMATDGPVLPMGWSCVMMPNQVVLLCDSPGCAPGPNLPWPVVRGLRLDDGQKEKR